MTAGEERTVSAEPGRAETVPGTGGFCFGGVVPVGSCRLEVVELEECTMQAGRDRHFDMSNRFKLQRTRRRRWSPQRSRWSSIVGIGLVVTALVLVSGIGSSFGSRSDRLSGSGLTMAGNGNGSPLIIKTGNYVTLECPEGTITIAGTQECSNTDVSQTICESSGCNLSLSGTMESGKTFGSWKAVADGGTLSVKCSTCISTTLATSDFWESSPPVLFECTVNPQITLQKGSPTMQSEYRQVWINWTDSNEYSTMFQWGTTTSYGLPVPESSGLSINLNALSADTTYYYQIEDNSNCGSAAYYNGTFVTGLAPPADFVGWVSKAVSNPDQLDQIGTPLVNAQVWPNAYCEDEYATDDVLGEFYPSVSLEQVSFQDNAATTNSSGAYALGFPLYDVYTITSSGTLPILVTVTLALSSSGTCTTSDNSGNDNWMGQPTSASNSHYLLQSNDQGYWNATDWISSSLSVSNDYAQFGLLSNTYNPAAVAIAFVHTNLVMCNVTVVSGGSQTVYENIGGTGFEDTQTYGGFTEALGEPGPFVSDEFEEWDTTGILNESGHAAVFVNSWAYDKPFGDGTNMETYVDQYSKVPPNATPLYVGPGGAIKGWYSGGSFTSTQGLSIEVGINTGWEGNGLSVIVPLSYTTSTVTSSQDQFICHFGGPSQPNEFNVYNYYLDSSQAGAQDAVYLHLWYNRTCTQGPGCGVGG